MRTSGPTPSSFIYIKTSLTRDDIRVHHLPLKKSFCSLPNS